MKSTTRCFVRVEDAEKRKGLREWLKSTGRERVPHSKIDRAPWFVAYESGRYEQNNGFCTNAEQMLLNGFIDCGTNIEFFKALVAINDKSIVNQWHIAHCPLLFKKLKGFVETVDNKRYVSAGGWFRPLTERLNFKFMCFSVPDEIFHKATASEIVERYTQNQP
jgi:hypothetical protein